MKEKKADCGLEKEEEEEETARGEMSRRRD